jgi:hypothetical protein
MVSEAQRRAIKKYDAEHMATIACKLRKGDAERFRQFAAERGKTPSALLREYVQDCIGGKK